MSSICASRPLAANCARAAASNRSRVRRAAARWVRSASALGADWVLEGEAAIGVLSGEPRLCDEEHATGTQVPYSACNETGTQLPIIAYIEVVPTGGRQMMT